MRTSRLLALIISIAALWVAGCGGGGQATPPPSDSSAIDGQVEIQGTAADYELLLDGQPVPGALQDDGTYSIENVPPGEHRVAVIGRDGMEGGYATVRVPDGERARAPRIVPEVGGQIVGIVTLLEDDALTPLEGVEVTARPATVIMPAGEVPGGETPDATEPDPGERPAIYPPPDDLPTFSAFTDENGSFLIPAVPQGEYTVTVAMPNMQDTWRWVWVQAGGTAVADFRLRPAIEPGVGTVEGRVVGIEDGQRRPLADARVTVYSEDRWYPIGPPVPIEGPEPADAEGGEGEAEPGVPSMPDLEPIAPPPFEGVSAITNERGEFSLNAPAGYGSIDVYLPGWAPVWREIRILPDETVSVNVTLEKLDDLPPPPPPPGEDDEGELPPPPPPPSAPEG